MTFEILMMLVVSGLFALAIRYAAKDTARIQHDAVRETARHFDLTLQQTDASSKIQVCARGEVNGVGVEVAIESRFNGEVDKPFLVCRAFVASADLADLEFVSRSLLGNLNERLFDAPNQEIGDADLDAAFALTSTGDSADVGLLRAPQVKESLLAAKKRVSDIAMRDGAVVVERDIFGRGLDVAKVIDIVKTTSEVAERLDEAS